jgi:hypothetical protein
MHFNDKKALFIDMVLIILPIFNSTTTSIGSFNNIINNGKLYNHFRNIPCINVIF